MAVATAPPAATYAAVLDGVHLWLDVDGPVSRARRRLRGGHPSSASSPATWPGSPGRRTTCWPARPRCGSRSAAAAADPDPARPGRPHPLGGGPPRRRPAAARPAHRRARPPSWTPSTSAATACTCGSGLPTASSRAATCCCSTPTTRCSATLPVTAHDGLVETLVGVDDLPAGYFGMLRLAVGTEAAWVRIRRRANDLADPHHAVLLPELYDAGPTRASARPAARPAALEPRRAARAPLARPGRGRVSQG